MPSEMPTYFMGDVYVGEVGFGFLVSDNSGAGVEPTIDEPTARAIVEAADGDINAAFSPANLFEISREEFELFRDTEIAAPGLPEEVTIWQVKK
ncbi:hypothetical protein BH20VER3_BH20VER3_09020 [soil metagenome]